MLPKDSKARRVIGKQHKKSHHDEGVDFQRDFIFLKPAVLGQAISSAESVKHGNIEQENINQGNIPAQDATVSIVGRRYEPSAHVQPQ